MKAALVLVRIGAIVLLLGLRPVLALDPSLDVSQYAHTSWTVKDGFALGNIYAMAQTPDGYLWLGGEFGLFRFDGVSTTKWQAPAGQKIPGKAINSLLVTRDGTLWIGAFGGLLTWSGGKLSRTSEIGGQFVASLFEDREGTVWVGTLETPTGRLCRIRAESTQCDAQQGAFGRAIWSLYEDSAGTLWAAAQSGLWRIKPGPVRRYPTPMELIALNTTEHGSMLIAVHGAGLMQFVGNKMESYPIEGAINSNRPLRDRDIDANRLLRDRDGGLWIGTIERGLIHVHNGRTDVFTKSDGLSGNVLLSLFEDREGDVWVATTGGLDRFRELPVATISVKQGLSSDATQAVLAARDGSIWIGAHEGLTRWKDGRATVFREEDGLLDDQVQSLFEDDRGRFWASTRQGLAYFDDDRFVHTNEIPPGEIFSIAGDNAGNLWLAERQSLLHLRQGRLAEKIPWPAFGHDQNASVLLTDGEGGLWLGFWRGGGVSYFKDRRVRASYTNSDGLGGDSVASLQLDPDGALWVATQGGVSRIKNGRIDTLTTKNGLPCDTINWTVDDDHGSFWLYTDCGLVRISRSELDAWIANPQHRIRAAVWDAADGVRLRSSAASAFSPRVTKSSNGKLWFVTGEGIQVIDPHHLSFNRIPPPVRIEQVVADHKLYWQNLAGTAVANLHLPARTRDLTIDYTALSLVAPDKIHFKYKLEGQDRDWREVVNDRKVQYSNLRPGPYRFRVIASNNSGVWNEQGDTLEFSMDPAYYQTNWFRAFCLASFLLLLWAVYLYRVRRLNHDFEMILDARVGERTRIARDLHDTLLQSFHALLLHLQAASQLLPERPLEAKGKLDRTIEQAESAVTEGRDAVQALRASTLESNDLARAISTLGEELKVASNNVEPQLRVAVEGESRNLHPIIRDEIYKIAAEALRNAFRHSHARQIEVEVRYEREQFRLRVRDNGRGVDTALLAGLEIEGHYGIRGMRERATVIGGKLVVWSEIDAGTEIELRVPGGTAYAKRGGRSLLSRRLSTKARV